MYDVIIVGGGPSGSAAAISLAKAGAEVALVDKSSFPRDKICGDAISLDVTKQLAQLDESLAAQFQEQVTKEAAYGVSLFAPNGRELPLPFYYQGQQTAGYLSKRYHFDEALFRFASAFPNVEVHEEAPVKAIRYANHLVEVTLPAVKLRARQVIGTDGAHSVVNRELGTLKTDKQYTSAGLRMYYNNVKGFHKDSHVELHFFKDTVPGYLWVFPLAGNQANVGIGMLASHVGKKGINLKKRLQELLERPGLKERFRDAYPQESPKGMPLPLGGKKRPVSGDHFLLAGDAAGFIDPFTGEGIGNAIRSGRFAARHVLKSLKAGRYDADFNQAYDRHYYQKMQQEYRISRSIQYLSQYPALFNFVVNRIQGNPAMYQLLIKGLEDPAYLKSLTRPGFYIKLLTGSY